MKKLLPLAFAAALFVGCTTNPSQDVTASAASAALQAVERVVTTVPTSGDLVSVADLSISGMSCEMMCGGSIKKTLAALPGVVSTEIKFNADEEMDHAIVTYDESKVNDKELAGAVGQLHDGQYQVKRIAVERRVQEETRDRGDNGDVGRGTGSA